MGDCAECGDYVDSMAMCVDDPTHITGFRVCMDCGGHGDDPYVDADGRFHNAMCSSCGGDGIVRSTRQRKGLEG